VAAPVFEFELQCCAICRMSLMDLCIECDASQQQFVMGEACVVAWGECNHAFHYHCISRLLKRRPVCPMDDCDWKFQLNR